MTFGGDVRWGLYGGGPIVRKPSPVWEGFFHAPADSSLILHESIPISQRSCGAAPVRPGAPIGKPLVDSHAADERHGTVIGACEREAAVYALAQLRTGQVERQLAAV